MLGIALGCIGLSYDDFCRLDFEEFSAIYEAYAQQRDDDNKQEWERMRAHATLLLLPHTKKGTKLAPDKVYPLPWDKKEKKIAKQPIDIAKQRKRMAELVEKLK